MRTEVKRDLSIWIALFTGPVAWLLSLQTNYLVVLYVCSGGSRSALYFSCLIFLALAASGIFLSVLNWKTTSTLDEDPEKRTRIFLSQLSILVSTLFFLIILAMTIPTLIQDPCIF